MAYEESVRSISLKADSSLASATGVPGQGGATPTRGKQYRFVKVTGAATAGLVTANTDKAIGVLLNKPQITNAAATVAVRGVVMVEVGSANSGVVTAGDSVSADSTGHAITNPGSGGSLEYGIALGTSSAAGQLIPVLIRVN